MGYTHYWYREQHLDPRTFEAYVRDVAAIIQAAPAHTATAGGYYFDQPLRICGPLGRGLPQLGAEVIAFNGQREDDLWHESFVIQRDDEVHTWMEPDQAGLYFNCCKTARKPYDVVVGAALIAFRFCFPKSRVSSDGDPEDWTESLALYKAAFPDRAIPKSGPWSALLTAEED